MAFVWSALLCAPYAAVQDHPPAAKPPALAAAMAKYRQELAAYLQARDAYQAAAKTYWASIAEKRRSRNGKRARGAALSIDDYVLDQPPVYSGPPKPRDPSKPPEPPQPPPYVPVVADFLAAAVAEFKFTPRAAAQRRRIQTRLRRRRGGGRPEQRPGRAHLRFRGDRQRHLRP